MNKNFGFIYNEHLNKMIDKKKNLTSFTILELKKELIKGNKSALKKFWLKIEKIGTPLIEPIQGDNNHKLVTFIIQANSETKNAVVVCSLANQDDMISNNVCERIENTDILYRSFIVLNGTRTIYTISKNNSLKFNRFYDNLMHNWDTLEPDPHNPKRFTQRYRREGQKFIVEYSVLEMPSAKHSKWVKKREDIIPGSLISMNFKSKILNAKRQIWIYTPNKFNMNDGPFHLLIIFDGKAFIEFTQTPLILDNLQADNQIPPTVAIFIHNYSGISRGKDLLCYPQFADFIVKELVPWAQENYNVSSNPAHSVLVGSSSGGLAASFIGLKYSETFRNILSQSGWYEWYPGYQWFQHSIKLFGENFVKWWNKDDEAQPEWLTHQFAKSKRLPLKFYLNVGNLETRAISHVRNFLKILQEKRYTYFYEEYPGGHEYIAWREYLPQGLIYLIGVQ
ncbi:MAG: alpha/beta hydrolase [Promethearchaeota archaeon]